VLAPSHAEDPDPQRHVLYSVRPVVVTPMLDNSYAHGRNTEALPDLIQYPGVAYK